MYTCTITKYKGWEVGIGAGASQPHSMVCFQEWLGVFLCYQNMLNVGFANCENDNYIVGETGDVYATADLSPSFLSPLSLSLDVTRFKRWRSGMLF